MTINSRNYGTGEEEPIGFYEENENDFADDDGAFNLRVAHLYGNRISGGFYRREDIESIGFYVDENRDDILGRKK